VTDAIQAIGPPAFHLLAKPSGATCNIDCTYCFFLSKQALYPNEKTRMSEATLEAYIRQLLESHRTPEVTVAWQGGEPTLMRIEFFRKAVELVAKYQRPGQHVQHTFQTNGLLIDDEWGAFLKEHRFLVGLSIDGPKEVHDRLRISKHQEPTFDAVFAAADLLKRHEVPFNTLTCVHRHNASRPLDVYRFLRRELGSTYLQFIPIVQARGFETTAPQKWDESRLPVVGTPRSRPGDPDSIVTDWSVDPEEYGQFLCKVWDEWIARDYGKVLVNFCETLVAQHLGLGSQVCVHAEFCGKGVVVEHDGGVYSCDHYVYPEYRLGSIRDRSLGDLVFEPQQVRFGYAKSESLPKYCRDCAFLTDCWGECPKNRLVRTPDGEPGLNYLCPGLKRFYAHAVPQAGRIARQLRRNGAAPRPRI